MPGWNVSKALLFLKNKSVQLLCESDFICHKGNHFRILKRKTKFQGSPKFFRYHEGRDTRVSQTWSERQTRSFVQRRFAVYGIFNSSTGHWTRIFRFILKEKKRKMVCRVQSTVKGERNWSEFCWQFAMWGAWMRCVRVFVDEKNV